MRDSMARSSGKWAKASLPRHNGRYGESYPDCPCTDCMAAPFTQAERSYAAEQAQVAREASTAARLVAQANRKVARAYRRSEGVKTILRCRLSTN